MSDADKYPVDGAWPWIKGQYTLEGIDCFSSKPGMKGLVAAGRFKTTSHLVDHHLGDPASWVGDPHVWADPETWNETVTGVSWGIQLPGYGTVFHVSGNVRQTVTGVDQTPDREIVVYEWLRGRGNETYDVAQLCGYFGLEAVLP